MSDKCRCFEDIAKLKECLEIVRDALANHPAYAQLTQEEEEDIGGDTAELSYLVRTINEALEESK